MPGLAQFYLGQRGKGAALLLLTFGIAWMFFASDSYVFILLALLLYFVTAVPAAIDAFYQARTGGDAGLLGSRRYVVLMLLTTGFSALPLLWQNPRFSRPAKIAWTVAVPLLAAVFFGLLTLWGSDLERHLRRL